MVSVNAQQAALLDGFGFDLLSRFQDSFGPAEIDVGGREVAPALVVVMMVIVADRVADRLFESAGQVIDLAQGAVPEGLVPVLGPALCLRVPRSAADMIHSLAGKPVGHRPLQHRRFPPQIFDLGTGGLARCVIGEPLLASLEELLRPANIEARRDPAALTELGNTFRAALPG